MDRRAFLAFGGAAMVVGVAVTFPFERGADATQPRPGNFPYRLTDAQWRARLSDMQYRVLRQGETERAGTSPLDKQYDPGVYHCAGCGQPLFEAGTKFNSRTGWPSFFAPFDAEHVREIRDTSHGMVRTEIVCARCGSHLGHVSPDGPPPTGERHCLNSVSLGFTPNGDRLPDLLQRGGAEAALAA